MTSNILLDDVELPAHASKPVVFTGLHSSKPLAGIDLDFTATSIGARDLVEALFKKESVQVSDPFVQRTYQAKLQRRSSSYQEGVHRYKYIAEVREIDSIPKFSVLEINGHQFPVIKYTETNNEPLGRFAVLRLTEEQLSIVRDILSQPTAEIRRIGVDDEPLTVRRGGALHWSHHTDGDEQYYKQIVRYFNPSPDDDTQKPFALASAVRQLETENLLVNVIARFETLLSELVKQNILSVEQGSKLLDSDWGDLVDESRSRQLHWITRRVQDADVEI